MGDGRRGGTDPKHSWTYVFGLMSVALVLAVFAGFGAWWTARSAGALAPYIGADASGIGSDLFSSRYPANERFQTELQQLRTRGKLTAENEALIEKSVTGASRELNIPPALLWCLLFQESRLDHLLNIDASSGATGIGQFLFSSFYEVNFNLDRYTPDNLAMMKSVLGADPRPIGAFRRDPYQLSSYYYIPTAIASSASYLNNRYYQLKGALDRKGVPYHRDLLWLYSAMAYNKGGRSVLSFWNVAREEGGWHRLGTLVQKPSAFFGAVSDARYLRPALERIWPPHEAGLFAREVKTHLEKIRACSVSTTSAQLLDSFPDDGSTSLFREFPRGKAERSGI